MSFRTDWRLAPGTSKDFDDYLGQANRKLKRAVVKFFMFPWVGAWVNSIARTPEQWTATKFNAQYTALMVYKRGLVPVVTVKTVEDLRNIVDSSMPVPQGTATLEPGVYVGGQRVEPDVSAIVGSPRQTCWDASEHPKVGDTVFAAINDFLKSTAIQNIQDGVKTAGEDKLKQRPRPEGHQA